MDVDISSLCTMDALGVKETRIPLCSEPDQFVKVDRINSAFQATRDKALLAANHHLELPRCLDDVDLNRDGVVLRAVWDQFVQELRASIPLDVYQKMRQCSPRRLTERPMSYL